MADDDPTTISAFEASKILRCSYARVHGHNRDGRLISIGQSDGTRVHKGTAMYSRADVIALRDRLAFQKSSEALPGSRKKLDTNHLSFTPSTICCPKCDGRRIDADCNLATVVYRCRTCKFEWGPDGPITADTTPKERSSLVFARKGHVLLERPTPVSKPKAPTVVDAEPPVRKRVTMAEIADAQRAVKAATNARDRAAMERHLAVLERAREAQKERP